MNEERKKEILTLLNNLMASDRDKLRISIDYGHHDITDATILTVGELKELLDET